MTRKSSTSYDVVLFDFDHMLFDSDESERVAFAAAMASIGVENRPDTFARYRRLNQAMWRRVEAGDLSPNDVKLRRFEAFLDEVGVDADPIAMGDTFVAGLTDGGELYPGARELLASLVERVTMAMVTNGIGSVQRRRIERLDLGRYFAVVAISGELAMSKPDRAIFDHVLGELGVADRSRVVMIGDSLTSDIAGARNAGIDSIWFDRHGARGATDATHTVNSIEELTSLLS